MARFLDFIAVTIRLLACWAYLVPISACFFPVFLVLLPSRRLRILVSNVYGQMTGRVMLLLSGATIPPGVRRKLGATQPAIFISNHTSYLDIFLGIWAAPTGTLGTGKRETALIPFLGQLYALSGNVLIDRSNTRDAAFALRGIVGLIRRLRFSVWMWPEGTRSSDGRLLPFKRGFAHIALATRLPIVPIVVSNAHRCWPRGRAYTRPAAVDVCILPPVPTTNWAPETLDRHVAELHALFAAHLPDDQKPRSFISGSR